MNNKKALALGIVLLLIGQIVVFAQEYSYFHIRDLRHGAYLAAGVKYDGALYHLKKDSAGKLPETAEWRFEDAGKINGKQYYYIVDRLHDSAIMAGDNKDGDTYSQKNYHRKKFAMWTATEKRFEDGQIPVIFTDAKHGLDLVAGRNHDGEIYHQTAKEYKNAKWVLELNSEGDVGTGPDFYVVKQRLASLKFHTDVVAAIKHPPTLTLESAESNDSDVTQSYTVRKTVEHSAEESWSFRRAVKVSLYQELSVSSGFAGSGEVKSKTTFGLEVDQEWVKSDKRTTKNTLMWSIPVVAPPHSRVSVNAVIKILKRDVTFTATIENTMGNGEVKETTINGEWSGVQYVTGEINIDQEKL